MKVKNNVISSGEELDKFEAFLLNHFNYSIKDINNYNELTSEEKKLISEELFNKFCTK